MGCIHVTWFPSPLFKFPQPPQTCLLWHLSWPSLLYLQQISKKVKVVKWSKVSYYYLILKRKPMFTFLKESQLVLEKLSTFFEIGLKTQQMKRNTTSTHKGLWNLISNFCELENSTKTYLKAAWKFSVTVCRRHIGRGIPVYKNWISRQYSQETYLLLISSELTETIKWNLQ